MSEDKKTNIADKVVVVTGAARGMGASIAKGLLDAGAKVAAVDLSWGKVNEYWDEVGSVRNELDAHGERCICREGDISVDRDMDRTYDAILRRFGRVDALINNAALLQHHLFRPTGRTTILDSKDADWEKMFQVNVFGTLKVIRRFVKPMIAQNSGAIINLVSSGIVTPAPRPESLEQPYMSSKAAIANMTYYLAHELRQHNISANCVSPGHAEMTGWEIVDVARQAVGIKVPTSRQVPEHIVPLMTFLASHDATNGPSGRHIDTNDWNLMNGQGTPAAWLRENVEKAAKSA